jgi:signal transduction histidine kinase
MAKPYELLVLSKEKQNTMLLDVIKQAGLDFQLRFCQSLAELKALPITPPIIIFIEPEMQDFSILRRDYPFTAFVLLQENYDESLALSYIQATSGHYLLNHQISLLPAMLQHIKNWQDNVADRDGKVQQQQAALLGLATSSAISSGDWENALREICTVTAKTLKVSRVSVWLFDTFRSKLRCEMLYSLQDGCFESGLEISSINFPDYFLALQQNRVIVASDASRDSETQEFSNSYLVPLDIQSMLDAPIRLSGECVGVVCFEQQGEKRNWTIDDQVFAAAAADLVALVLEGLEHRRIEEAIKQTEKLQSLGLLASGIAHDFNNLLTVILSQSSLLADMLEKEHPAYRFLHHIVSTTRQASALTKQLLTYAGNKPVQMAAVLLADFMEEYQDFLRLAVPAQIQLKIGDAGKLGIDADVTQLQQVLMNLVINATEAIGTMPGCLYIDFVSETLQESFAKPNCYKSETFAAGDYVRLTVRDTGQGIEEATLKRIFEPFFSTKSSGRGVGLATILGVVRAHGGAIWIETVRGLGTSFHLYFRRATVESIERTATGAIPAIVARTVLVVDDAPEIVESISEILEINGLSTLAAYNGIEALKIYREESELIDLILVDMSMPGMNGAETFAQLRKIRADVKVILLSGYSDQELLRQFPNERPSALLAKPYDVNTLLQTVWKHLGQ